MKLRLLAVAILALGFCAAPALADGATPWVDDQKLIDQVMHEVQSGGVMAVERHRDELEHALANAQHSSELAVAAGFRLTDGLAGTPFGKIMGAKGGQKAT